uniref:Uncharacterized protein n=1 Tax=Amphimedon queenslandica TaxID=400682 RepID=A0A1X7T8C2_AMPQE
MKPCRLQRCDVNRFGEANYPLPPSCLISVLGSPDAVPTLHYSIPLEDPTTSSSIIVHESTSVSSTGGASASATVDVYKVKKVINDVLVTHYADLTSLPMEAVPDLANQLFALRLVNNAIKDKPSIKKCIDEFKASLKGLRGSYLKCRSTVKSS